MSRPLYCTTGITMFQSSREKEKEMRVKNLERVQKISTLSHNLVIKKVKKKSKGKKADTDKFLQYLQG